MKTNGRQRDWEGPSAMTNYEKIKAMSIEEMVEFIADNYRPCPTCTYANTMDCGREPCHDGIVNWLQKEADANE